MKASDVRSSLERVFRVWPHGQGAVAQFYGGIKGAEACNRKRCDLSRGIVTDDAARTVTFHLTAPDPIFLYKLAQPFASILPSSTSLSRPASAGPGYRSNPIASVGRDTVRLVRNGRFHEWSSVAQPAGFPDEIVVSSAESQRGRADAVQRGEADLTSLNPFDPFSVAPTWRPQLRRYLLG